MKKMLVNLKLNRRWRSNNAGEVCGLPVEAARFYVKNGWAELTDVGKATLQEAEKKDGMADSPSVVKKRASNRGRVLTPAEAESGKYEA